MALASVLSIRLSMEPEDEGLRELCGRIFSRVRWGFSSEPTFPLVVGVLKFVASVLNRNGRLMDWDFFTSGLDRLSTTQGLWLSRVTFQIIWRRRCVQGPTGVLGIHGIESMCRTLAMDGD